MTDERDELDRWLESLNNDSGPTPDPRFVRDLRAGLIAQAERTTSMMATNRHILPAPTGRWLDRRALLQLAAVMALVVAWIGTLAGGGPREITDRFAGYFQQDEAEEAAAPSMYRGNIARTGVIDDSGPAEHPYVAWEVTPAEPGFNIVNATETTILLAYEAGGRLVALDRADGAERWKYDSECQIVETTPAIVQGTIYLAVSCRGDFASSVIALNEVDGREIWRSDFEDEVRTSPLIVDDTLYAMTTDYPPALVAIDVADGKLLWQKAIERVDQPGVELPNERRFGNMSAFSPSYGDGLLYVTSFDGLIHGVDAETGDVRWTFDTGANSISTPAFADGTIYFSFAGILMTDGTFGFVALDAETGNILWEADLPVHSPFGGPLVAGDLVLFSLSNAPGDLITFAWNRATGTEEWRESIGGTSNMAGDVLYLLDQRSGYALAINPTTGAQLWRAFLANVEFSDAANGGAHIRSEPVIGGGALITSSQSTHVLVVQSTPTSPGTISSPTAASSYDFTGLESCNPPAPFDWAAVEGEPAFSLTEVDQQQEGGGPASLRPADLPTGEPAPAETQLGIEETIVVMSRCAARGNTSDLSGFFSTDYVLRPSAQVQIEHGSDLNRSFAGHLQSIAEGANRADLYVLPDGRIAMLIPVSDIYSRLYVFVQNGDRWVIDEFVEITPRGGLG